MALKNHDPVIATNRTLVQTIRVVFDDHAIEIPKEVFEDRMDLGELINLGLNKKQEVERLVQELWDKKEKEKETQNQTYWTTAYGNKAQSYSAGSVGTATTNSLVQETIERAQAQAYFEDIKSSYEKCKLSVGDYIKTSGLKEHK